MPFVDTDLHLIRRMKQGDEDAMDRFVRRYYTKILQYCAHHCFDAAYAEDLAQETFVRFFANLPDYRYQGKTLNYLYTVAGNLCKNYYGKNREIPLEYPWPEGEAESVQTGGQIGLALEMEKVHGADGQQEMAEDSIVQKMTMEWALAQLPETYREVIELYYFQERKLAEISDALEIGLPLVKYRLRQAKLRLGKILGEEGTKNGY